MARHRALDRLRALAVVAMVQGHTFSALLADDALPSSWMQLHALVHGLTAPAFLFGAGLAFGVATYPRYAEHRSGGRALLARLRRYAGLLVLGYGLQLPGASLLATLQLGPHDLGPVLRVGPLHLIALCMTLCQLSILAVPSPRAHAALVLALGMVIAAVAPWVHGSHVAAHAGWLVGPWLDMSTGSQFPVFPWASFALLGVAGGAAVVRHEAVVRDRGAWAYLGLALTLGTYLLYRLGVRLSEPQWFWQASPLNMLFRLGLVCCLLALLHERRASPVPPVCAAPPSPEPGSWTTTLARHSLVAYVVHLLLLYGTPFTPNLASRLGRRLDLTTTSLVFAAIMLLTALAARAAAWLARERPPVRSWVHAALTLLGVLVLMRGV